MSKNRCAASTLSDKIISAENDLVSVCVFGVQNMKNSNQFDGVYVLQELEVFFCCFFFFSLFLFSFSFLFFFLILFL